MNDLVEQEDQLVLGWNYRGFLECTQVLVVIFGFLAVVVAVISMAYSFNVFVTGGQILQAVILLAISGWSIVAAMFSLFLNIKLTKKLSSPA